MTVDTQEYLRVSDFDKGIARIENALESLKRTLGRALSSAGSVMLEPLNFPLSNDRQLRIPAETIEGYILADSASPGGLQIRTEAGIWLIPATWPQGMPFPIPAVGQQIEILAASSSAINSPAHVIWLRGANFTRAWQALAHKSL